jgi:hypothetical protein
VRRPRLILYSVILLSSGCGANRGQWEVTFENKAVTPCSVNVAIGPGSRGSASADGVANGEAISLIGGQGGALIESVKVTRDGTSQTLTPKVQIPAGMRYKIVVAADGKVETSIEEK